MRYHLMTALLRYQAAIMLRSQRWLFPFLLYAALLAAGATGPTPLSDGLTWSAAALVPTVALLTRLMLTAEPDAARACVAVAAGPVRAQFAVLVTALFGGMALGLVGSLFELATAEPASGHGSGGLAGRLTSTFDHPGTLAAGLGTTVVCLLIGSAVGALCNPPLLRQQGMALLATSAAVVFALASAVSPASAALRSGGSALHGAHWPGGLPFAAAACLLAVTWAASMLAAAHRDRAAPG